jgi:hypothetical protein
MAAQDNHVKFAEGTHLEPDTLQVVYDGSQYHLPEAHIGMLRNHHTYNADLPVNHSLGPDVSVTIPTYNLYVRVLEVFPTVQDGDSFTTPVKMEIKTIKEGRIREKILLTSNTEKEKTMEVYLVLIVVVI